MSIEDNPVPNSTSHHRKERPGPTAAVRAGVALALAAFAVVSGPHYAQAQDSATTPQTTARRISQVTQTLEVPTLGAAARKLAVEIDAWHFEPGNTTMTVPAGGPTIISVGAGRMSMQVGSDERVFNAGDFWSVPAGTVITVSIRPPTRGGILQTITVTPAS